MSLVDRGALALDTPVRSIVGDDLMNSGAGAGRDRVEALVREYPTRENLWQPGVAHGIARPLSHVTAMQRRARRPKGRHVQERLGGIDPMTDRATGLRPLQGQTRPARQVEDSHPWTHPGELLEHIE